jgi:hypothetical protein
MMCFVSSAKPVIEYSFPSVEAASRPLQEFVWHSFYLPDGLASTPKEKD